MLLLVDIGNSRIKWRWGHAGALLPGGADALPGAGHEAALFARIWDKVETPSNIVVSNVAGERVAEAIGLWSRTRWQRKPLFVKSVDRQCGVTNGYEAPDCLGVDRWCSLIGARALVPGTVCVVDCGTAITLDLLAADGTHQGGLIAPGLRSMIHSLTATAMGARADVTPAPFTSTLGRTTSDCIRAGVLAAAVGLVEHTLGRLAVSEDTEVLLTGGDAPFLASALRRPVRVEADLLFHGLLHMGVPEGDACGG